MDFTNKESEDMKKKFEKERVQKEVLKKENDEVRAMCNKHSCIIVQLGKRVVQCERYSCWSNI